MRAGQLRAIRADLKLTQRGLADAIGYRDANSVSRWERGVEPVPRVVALAVEHLHCIRSIAKVDGRFD